MVSTLPGPHDYRSAGIAPALDHVGAGVLEECQPIRVEYRGLDHLLVGTPHGSPVPWNCHRPACQSDQPSPGENIPRIRRRAIAGGRRASARRVIRGGPGARAGCPATLPSHKPRPWLFFALSIPFLSPFTVSHETAKSGSRPLPFTL